MPDGDRTVIVLFRRIEKDYGVLLADVNPYRARISYPVEERMKSANWAAPAFALRRTVSPHAAITLNASGISFTASPRTVGLPLNGTPERGDRSPETSFPFLFSAGEPFRAPGTSVPPGVRPAMGRMLRGGGGSPGGVNPGKLATHSSIHRLSKSPVPRQERLAVRTEPGPGRGSAAALSQE